MLSFAHEWLLFMVGVCLGRPTAGQDMLAVAPHLLCPKSARRTAELVVLKFIDDPKP